MFHNRVLNASLGAKEIAHRFGVSIDDPNAFHEVPRVAFHVNGVLVPIDIFVCLVDLCLEGGKVLRFGIEYQTCGRYVISTYLKYARRDIPSTHNIALSTKHLRQTADEDVGVW